MRLELLVESYEVGGREGMHPFHECLPFPVIHLQHHTPSRPTPRDTVRSHKPQMRKNPPNNRGNRKYLNE
jgi:hypothetical protein